MEYKIFVNNPWQENTVVLYDGTGEAAVVDCGCLHPEEEEQLERFLSGLGLKPVLLLNTHLHVDHIMGNGFMKKKYGLSTQAGEADNFLVENAVEYAAMLGYSRMVPPPPVGKFLRDGDTVRFGETLLHVLAVPGHSPGGLCFYGAEDALLLSGDSLFAGSVGRADLPGGNYEALLDAVRNRLLVLPEDVKVIPGHGPVTTIGEEKRYNPFFG